MPKHDRQGDAGEACTFGGYRLIERLAVGASTEIFVGALVGEHGFEKKVVIERMLRELRDKDADTASFVAEAKVAAMLVHPTIAHTLELGSVEGVLYAAREYVDGVDVLSLLRELATRARRLEPPIAVWIIREILEALDYAHTVIDDDGKRTALLHGDLSPSSVLLSMQGDVKLIGFGGSRAYDPRTDSGNKTAKYGYFSPEEVNELTRDTRTDLFSAGVVLAELLIGRRLFHATYELDVLLMVRDAKLDRFEKYSADIDPDLADIVRKALKKSPHDRWGSAAEFREALDEWLFEHRLRITKVHVAGIVADVRDAIAHGRRTTMSAATRIDVAPMNEPPGEIAINYDVRHKVASVEIPPLVQPDPVVEQSAREQARVTSGSPSASKHDVRSVHERVEMPPVEKPSVRVADLSVTDHGVVEAPMADTISKAVNVALLLPRSDDASFDDLTDPMSQPHLERPPAEVTTPTPPPPPALALIDTPADETGELAATSPLRVLFRLMSTHATGLLVASIGGVKKEVYFRDGRPEYVASNIAGELFGTYLVSKGVLSDGELAMALAMMPRYGGRLGDTLIGIGLMKPLDVFRHLTRQVRNKLVDICTWTKGNYAWYAGRENTREAFRLDFNAFEILGAGALALADIEAWVARHANQRFRAVRLRRSDLHRFEVDDLVELFDSLDGTVSVERLAGRARDREIRRRMYRMLYLLEACELITAA